MLIYFKMMITKKNAPAIMTGALKRCVAIVNKNVACYFFSTSSLDNPQKDVTR